jgi:hypothetical protein
MKIAICIYGQYRTGKFAYRNLRNFFGDLYDQCDFFIHTWDKNTYRTLKSLNSTLTRPDEKLLDCDLLEYKNLYNPKSFMVDNLDTFRQDVVQRFGPSGPMINLYHSVYYSTQLMLLYEKSMSFQYDIVVRLRPDILFDPSRKLIDDINELLSKDTRILTLRTDDVYLVGHRNSMIQTAEFYTETICNRGSSEWLLLTYYEYLEKRQIKYAPMSDSRFTPHRKEFDFLDTIEHFNQLVYLNTCLYSGTVNYSYQDLINEFRNDKDPECISTTMKVFEHIFGKKNADYLSKKNKR